MNEKEKKHISKFLSLVLRHRPGTILLTLDANGWADVDQLLARCALHGLAFSREDLDEVVATNNKQRFAFNTDGTRIRASQGHSVEVDLDLQASTPPDVLYHGTTGDFLPAIRETGLLKMDRQHVHLSAARETAVQVGSRKGAPVVLTVHARRQQEAGAIFFLSANGVWLTDHVPPAYISF